MADPTETLGDFAERINIARHLAAFAARAPERPAVQVARGARGETRIEGITARELDARSNAVAAGLIARGLKKGDRACVFVRAGIDLIAITFGLLKAGAVPVLIDPGMERKQLLGRIAHTEPRVFVGIPLAQVLRKLFPQAFRSVEIVLTVGPRFFWGGSTLKQLVREHDGEAVLEDTSADAEAAILFTSGSTGPAKGVVYTHRMFEGQIRALGELYAFEDGEVDAACFPLFALFSPALGMTCVFPDLDPSKPATCDPARIVAAIEEAKATSTFGSPAIWRRVVPWCIERGVKLPTLRRVLIAGAPVPPRLIADFEEILTADADVHTPYGATECLPVASVSGAGLKEGLRKAIEGGAGTCVGQVAPGIDLRVVEITDEPIAEWSEDLVVEDGQLGEICVRGPVVTREYNREPEHNAAAKIRRGDEVWHRIGDIGYRDREGRVWICGRKSHRLETEAGVLAPVPIENIYNAAPRVHRTALVGVGERGAERPVLFVQPEEGEMPERESDRKKFIEELVAFVESFPAAREVATFLFHPGFPVDVRHNAKIKRELLKKEAEAILS